MKAFIAVTGVDFFYLLSATWPAFLPKAAIS